LNPLLQISDPHFGTERPGAVDALVRLVQQLRPALVLLSGDITQRATAAQFAAAAAFVRRLGDVPVLAVPGNHDIPLLALWARLARPYGRYERAFGPARDGAWTGERWHVQALNTTRWWRHKNGEVSRGQVQAVATRLRAAPAAAVKVVVTHQPVAVTQASDRTNLLRGHAAAVRAWHDAGADLIVGGHVHLPYVVPLHPCDQPPLWAVQAGTAVSTRVRQGTRNSVTEFTAAAPGPGGDRHCSVRFWEWPAGGGDFEARAPTVLPLRPEATSDVAPAESTAPPGA